MPVVYGDLVIWRDIDADGDISFDLPDEMEELLETQVPNGLTYENVASIIKVEVYALIFGHFIKNPEYFFKRMLPKELRSKADVMLGRIQRTIDALITESMKERVLLRKTTRAYTFESVDWHLGTHHVKAEEKKKTDVPYVSLEMKFSKPCSERIMSMNSRGQVINASRKDDIAVALELHKDDLKDLIKELQEIEKEIS